MGNGWGGALNEVERVGVGSEQRFFFGVDSVVGHFVASVCGVWEWKGLSLCAMGWRVFKLMKRREVLQFGIASVLASVLDRDMLNYN